MKIAVVGAGPAGVRAVEVLVAAGHRPVWIDEAPDGGGRIYQRPPTALTRDPRQLYGFEAERAQALHATLDSLKPRADWRPGTLVWHIRPGERQLSTLHKGQTGQLSYDAALLCTGAMDRVIPVPGWTLPGVTTLGGAQIALKTQGCAIGEQVALAGTGPLLWLLAWQYLKSGARIAALVDTTPFSLKARHAAALVCGGATFLKGLWFTLGLRLSGIPVFEGASALSIEGEHAVTGLRWRDRSGREHRVDCDAAAIGWGLRPESQLADLAGVPFAFDSVQHNWNPSHDARGRTSVKGLYLAGDGAGIGGADLAELAGARAALALLEGAGQPFDQAQARTLDQRMAGHARFRAALERAFPFPAAMARSLDDDTLLCRCEAIRVGELRAAASEAAAPGLAHELNRAKAFTRIGMGRCQGRVCGAAAAEIMAAHLQCPIDQVGRVRAQPPVKPIPIRSEAQAQ